MLNKQEIKTGCSRYTKEKRGKNGRHKKNKWYIHDNIWKYIIMGHIKVMTKYCLTNFKNLKNSQFYQVGAQNTNKRICMQDN